MAYCTQCGVRLSSEGKFCDECGAPIWQPVIAEPPQSALDPGSLVEVITREPVPLSLAALEWLREAGHLSVAPASPLRSLVGSQCRTSADERSAARQALVQRGIVSSKGKRLNGLGSSPRATALSESMKILGQPEARVRISIVAPGKKPVVVPLFLAGESAVFGYFSVLLFKVCCPVTLAELKTSIGEHLETDQAHGGIRRLTIRPSQLRLSSLIWRAAKRQSKDAVPREAALRALGRAGLCTADAVKGVSGLVQTGFAEEDNGMIHLRQPYRAAMDLVWSGHLLHIERVPLQETPVRSGSTPKNAVRRLLFVGPPRRRALCRMSEPVLDWGATVEGGDKRSDSLGQAEQLLNLDYLPRKPLTDLIEGLLGE